MLWNININIAEGMAYDMIMQVTPSKLPEYKNRKNKHIFVSLETHNVL